MAAPKASSMEVLQTRGFSVVKAPGNTASPAVGELQGVANIPKTSPIIDIKGSGAPSDGGGFYDLLAISRNSLDALGKATSTLDTKTALRLAGLKEEVKQDEKVDNPPKHSEVAARGKWTPQAVPAARLAKEATALAEKKTDEDLEKVKNKAEVFRRAVMESNERVIRRLKNRTIRMAKAAAKAEKKAKEEVEKAKAEAKVKKAVKEKALEEAMKLSEEAAKEAARLDAAKAAEEAAKLETEKAAKEAARTKALKEAEAAHLEKLKAAEEALRLEAEKVAAEALRKAEEEAERLEAEKNAKAQTLAAKDITELATALMEATKANEAQEAGRAKVPRDADFPRLIRADDIGQVVRIPRILGKRRSLGSQEKPPAKRVKPPTKRICMFLEEAEFINKQKLRLLEEAEFINKLKRQQLEREAAELKKLVAAYPRHQQKPSAIGEPSNLSKGVTEQGPHFTAGEFLPEAATARLFVEDAFQHGLNNEQFGRVLADNDRLWRQVQTMEKKINTMSGDIKIILEKQSHPPPMPKPAAAMSTMTGVERDAGRLHALIAQHNRLSAQIAVTVSQMSDVIAGENK